ncbi:Fe2+-dependent dioxygenase [Arenimonas sp. MALMAid1274]|uniref:Fe2+-dependent dioxygenase n=1 Tax=Arenimonas sp. MALMAid1274 TaxID=3411630 RepID=UPI003BA25957
MSLFCIADVMDAEACARARDEFARLPSRDGRLTAGWAARGAKNNEQLDASDPGVQALAARLLDAVSGHPTLERFARPARFGSPLLSRYRPGQGYGTHVDDALMGKPALRTDLAWTLFLSGPDDYDGGELVIESHEGETPVKLPAGALVVYDCGALHRVAPVTRGERLACVGWIQSRVRDGRQRELLFTLDQTRRSLHAREGESPEFLQLSQVHSQLLRMWAEAAC